MYPASHSFSLFSLLFSFHISFSFFSACYSRIQTARTNALPNATSLPCIAIEVEAEHKGTQVACHSSLSSPISWQFRVVHKLSPSRARRTKEAMLARHCRPYGKEGNGAREWRRCRLIFSHRINPAPASRRGLILHGGCRRPCVCVRVTCESSVEHAARSPAYRPNDPSSYRWSTDPRISTLIKQYIPRFSNHRQIKSSLSPDLFIRLSILILLRFVDETVN